MTLKVGITYPHGIALELIKQPPKGVEYRMLTRKGSHGWSKILTPEIMWSRYYDEEVDIVEATIFPVLTTKPMVYTPADADTLFGFDVFGIPVPKVLRALIVLHIFRRLKSYQIVFKSRAGKESLNRYPKPLIKPLLKRSKVVYPAVEPLERPLVENNKGQTEFLFVGKYFFSKGGANVVDAFLDLWRHQKNIRLKIFTRPELNDAPMALRQIYLKKIENCPAIELNPVLPRKEFLEKALKGCDVFLMPTYREPYGFGIQEAMAHGKPVIATDIFAIPEIITHNESGFLLPVRSHPFITNLKRYYVEDIPKDFKELVDKKLYAYMKTLIDNEELRAQMGLHGWREAKEKFSFERRNKKMLEIYMELLDTYGSTKGNQRAGGRK